MRKKIVNYYQSESSRLKIGRQNLRYNSRFLFMSYSLLFLASFLVGIGLVSRYEGSQAASFWRISPSGSDSNPCTSAQPCQSMGRAFQVASPGDIVEMEGGTYSYQEFGPASKGVGAAFITYRPVSGASVSLNSATNKNSLILNDVDNIEIQNITTRGWSVSAKSDRVTLRNVKSFVGGNFITSASNVSVIDNEIAYQNPLDGLQIKVTGKEGDSQVRNLLIDGLFMHDITRAGYPDAHTDCIQLASGINFIIRNSRFVNCSTQGLFINTFRPGGTNIVFGGEVDGGVVENNFFGPAHEGFNSLIVGYGSPGGTVKNITIRNNTLSQAGRTSYNPAPPNVRWINNIAPKTTYACNVERGGGVVHQNNLYTEACDGNFSDSNLLSHFVNVSNANSSTWNLHLKAGASAIDRLASNYTSVDIDGQARPIGVLADIGADEYGTGGSTPAPPPAVPAAPVVTVTASPTSLQSGSSATLNWSATNSPSTCTASGDWSGSKAASGTQSTGILSTVKTYTYTLSCSNTGGSGSASATVNVTATTPPPPLKPVVSLQVSPSTINQGSSATLSWSATNSPSTCTASGDWSGSKAASGTQSTGILSTVKTYTYTLTCTNSGGSTTGSVAVVVLPVKPVVTISAAPQTVKVGSSATLSWSATNSPSTCTASGDWNGSKAASGTQSTGELNTKKTYTYTLTCSNTGGSSSASVAVTANNSGNTTGRKPKVKLTVSPSVIEEGQQATLAWVAEDGTNITCTARDGWSGSKPAQGTQTVTPDKDGQTYTITCENENGGESASTSVSVAAVKEDGSVTVNNKPVPNLKVSNPAIVGETVTGQPASDSESDTVGATIGTTKPPTPLFETTRGKLAIAGVFATLVTTLVGSIYIGRRLLSHDDTSSFSGPTSIISGT